MNCIDFWSDPAFANSGSQDPKVADAVNSSWFGMHHSRVRMTVVSSIAGPGRRRRPSRQPTTSIRGSQSTYRHYGLLHGNADEDSSSVAQVLTRKHNPYMQRLCAEQHRTPATTSATVCLRRQRRTTKFPTHFQEGSRRVFVTASHGLLRTRQECVSRRRPASGLPLGADFLKDEEDRIKVDCREEWYNGHKNAVLDASALA